MAKTIFSPPRNKPKLSLPQPTLAVGQPMPMIQTINRPVNLVDDEGNVHGRLGENPNGPEKVTVSPPPGPTNDPAGGPNYASGGTLMIGGRRGENGGGSIGYDTQEVTPDGGGSSNPYPSTIGTGIFGPNWQPPTSWNPAPSGPVYGPPAPTYPSQPQQVKPNISTAYSGGPANAMYQAQQQQIAARNSALDYRARVLDAQGNLVPYRQATYDARGNVIAAQGQQNQMQKGYLQQVGQNDKIKLGELEGIYAASKNAPDILNTAEAKNRYNAEDRRAGQMGVAPEAEVNLPPEYNGPRVAGVRPKIMSQEQRLSEKAGYEDPIRSEQLSIAKNIVDLQGTDVQAAQLAAAKAGLSLDQAQEIVKKAELEADYAGIISSRRDIQAQEAGIAPEAGMVRTKPEWGVGDRWVTAREADQLEAQYRENVQQPYNTQLQGQGSQYAALSLPELLNTIPKVTGGAQANPLYIEPVKQEIIRRLIQQGYTPEQAQERANAIIQQEMASRKSGSGLTEPVTVAPGQTPAAAPTGTPAVTGPALPPGYIP